VLFLWSCQTPNPQEQLADLIRRYENFEAYDPKEFPLGDFSEERFEKEAVFSEQLIDQLQALPKEELDEDDQISHALLLFELNEKQAAFEYKTHWNPILSDDGFHTSLTYTVRPITSRKAALEYLKLLKSIPRYIEQQKVLIQKGLEAGMGQPLVIFKGYDATYEKHILVDSRNHFYYSPFKNLPKTFSNSFRDSLRTAALEVIEKDIIPTFKGVKRFFQSEYYPKTRSAIGISKIPNGKAFYQSRIEYYTTLPLSPEEIHQKGLEEVALIKLRMEEVIKRVGFKGDLSAFIDYLRTDPQFYATTPEELLKEAAYIAKKMDAQLPKLFHTLPRKPYGVAPVPASIAPKYTTGRYSGSNRDDEAGYYWVNTYALDKRPLYVLEALTLHEAVPGHHLQISLNAELETLPRYRRDAYLSAFGEGWGLYSEYLGIEAGFYQSPYSRFGRLTYEMWRAARLVVDTGMHMYGWSRERAMQFMSENTALSLHNVKTETDRYITWPGQALSYKIGELTIKRLRKEAEQALGQSFDIREFHHQVLRHGSVPLSVLEAQVRLYINEELAKQKS